MATTRGITGRRGLQEQAALREALNPNEPCFPFPKDLHPKLRDLWTDTVNSKTGDYWSIADIPILKLYCRNSHDIERLTEEIEDEGEIILNANGNPVVNPKIMVRGFAESKLLAVCTKLRLQPSSRMNTDVEANQTNKKGKAKRAAKVMEEDDDNLLAGDGVEYDRPGSHVQ